MAAERHINVYQGDTYTHELRLKDSSNVAINITGRVYSGQIRKAKISSNVIATFTTSITDAPNGKVTFSLLPNITANIPSGIYVYDLQELNGAIVTTLLTGNVTISKEITHG